MGAVTFLAAHPRQRFDRPRRWWSGKRYGYGLRVGREWFHQGACRMGGESSLALMEIVGHHEARFSDGP
jgi:hypothetical protein